MPVNVEISPQAIAAATGDLRRTHQSFREQADVTAPTLSYPPIAGASLDAFVARLISQLDELSSIDAAIRGQFTATLAGAQAADQSVPL